MNYRSSTELSKLLSTCLSPISPLLRPASLHSLCLRTAAIYATTALYEFHDKKSSTGSITGKETHAHYKKNSTAISSKKLVEHSNFTRKLFCFFENSIWREYHFAISHNNIFSTANNPGGVPNGEIDASTIDESMWDAVFPLLDAHFLQLVPYHLYEEFLDNVLCALEVAAHYDSNGNNLYKCHFSAKKFVKSLFHKNNSRKKCPVYLSHFCILISRKK